MAYNAGEEESAQERGGDNDRLSEKEQADTGLYVLPDDESEWTKLFDVLRLRLVTTELSEQEKSEGEGLLPYQNVRVTELPRSYLASWLCPCNSMLRLQI